MAHKRACAKLHGGKAKWYASTLAVPVLLSLIVCAAIRIEGGYAPADWAQSDVPGLRALVDPARIQWVQTSGPPGGIIYDLKQNPYNHDELFALTERRVYRSRDKGETWELMEELGEMTVVSAVPFEDRLFVCGEGVHYYDGQGNLVRILDGWYDRVVISDGKLFVIRGTREARGVRILRADPSASSFTWEDISPSEDELRDLVYPPEDVGFDYFVRPLNILALGDRILANIVLEVLGSGQFTNGYLYCSQDLGQSWSKVDIDMPERVIIANIIQDPRNLDHLMLPLRHNMIHELKSPLSSLLKESFDGGRTWQPVTDLSIMVNGITDVDLIGSARYLVCPFDGQIIRLSDSGYDRVDMPRVEGFGEIRFMLDTLLFDFDDQDIVYGKTGSIWFYGIVKSEDGMVTWRKMDAGIVASSPSIVLCHPVDPNVIFTSGNVIQEKYLTRDGGRTWEPFSPTIAGDELEIDPHDLNHIILVDEMSNIYESYDGGLTFQRINRDFSSAKVFDIDVASEDPERIYVSNIGVGISEYVPSTTDWRHLTGSPDYAYRIALDPEDSNILYATYSPKIFENHSSVWRYSPYQGENFGWTEILRVNNSRGITALAFDRTNPNRIFVGVIGKGGTIYVSNDKGRTWQKLNEHLTFTTIWGHSQLQIDPSDKNIVYAGTWGGGTYKTLNGGRDWLLLDQDHTFSPTWLAVSERDPNIVYACDRTGARIHRSNDSGRTWYTYYDFGAGYMLTSVAVIDPEDPDLIYASAFKPPMAHRGVLVKIGGGQVVANLSSGLPRAVIEIEIDPKNTSVLYVTTHIYGVFKSTDGGATWQRLDDRGTGLPRTGIYDIDVDPTNSSILYATAIGGELPDYMLPPGMQNLEGKCGVYKSTDGGEHWTLILETVSEARGIDVDPRDHDNLYVADMMGGVWVSNDGGLNWRQENNGLGSTSMTSVKIRVNYVYASTQGSGVYSGVINDNGSITWDPLRSNKPKAEVFKIQVECDPNNPDRIYASAYPGGLLRSDDGGRHWYDKNFLTPSIRVTDPNMQGYYSFAINPNNSNIVWMGVYGKGMFVSYDGMDFDMFANGVDNKMMGKRITKVVINPANPSEVYVSSEEGVFVTRDGGQHWEEMNDGLQTLDVRTLKVVSFEWPPFEDGFENGTADQWELESGWGVVMEEGNYVLRGTGHRWARAGSELWGDYTFAAKLKLILGSVHVVFRRGPEGRYFLGFSGDRLYLWKEFNRWSEFAFLEDKPGRYALGQWHDLRVEVEAGLIRVFVDGVLRISYTDPDPLLEGAIAFESLEDSEVCVDDVRVRTYGTETLLFAGTGGYGIYCCDAADRIWRNLGRTLGSGWWSAWERRMYQFSSVLFDPVTPGRVYLGHFPSGFFISNDSGRTWRDSSLGLGNDGIFSLTMHPRDRNVIWAGTYNGVARSVDGGRTWTLKSVGMPPEQWPFTVAIDDEDPNVMYASTKNGQNKGLSHRNSFYGVVMKSTDAGGTWFKIMEGLDERSEFYSVLIHPTYHNILFLSTSKGVYVSNDAGSTWQAINSGLPTAENQARDNVAENLALTADMKYLVLGLSRYGVWKADLSDAIVLNRIPTASFSYFPAKPTVKDTVGFQDSSTDQDGSVVSWRWDFGDGTTSTEQNPEHRYVNKGSYEVTLVVTDERGTEDTAAATLSVFNLPPTAQFAFSPSDAAEGEEIRFTDMSEDPEGNLTSWKWDFGDGHESSERNPTHKYERVGDFTVSLVVADDEGETSHISKNLAVGRRGIFIETPLGMGIVAGAVVAVVLMAWIITRRKWG